jgi:hypothetical protein
MRSSGLQSTQIERAPEQWMTGSGRATIGWRDVADCQILDNVIKPCHG